MRTGKKQICQEIKIKFVDVKLSQLAPTDLRGLPVAEDGISKSKCLRTDKRVILTARN